MINTNTIGFLVIVMAIALWSFDLARLAALTR